MTSRRSFFSRLAKAAAIIALAPQIAFRAPKLATALEEQPKNLVGFWIQTSRQSACYSEEYLNALEQCTLIHATIHRFSFEDFQNEKRMEAAA